MGPTFLSLILPLPSLSAVTGMPLVPFNSRSGNPDLSMLMKQAFEIALLLWYHFRCFMKSAKKKKN